jgi:hypothetical protein
MSGSNIIALSRIPGRPIGRHPWATTVSTFTLPVMATPTVPERRTRSPMSRALAPERAPPLARPPILAETGKA